MAGGWPFPVGVCSAVLTSFYEFEERNTRQSSTTWIGYKIYLAEACDDQRLHSIINAKTTAVQMLGCEARRPVRAGFAAEKSLHRQNRVGNCSLEADHLVAGAQDHYAMPLGPILKNGRWQIGTEMLTVDLGVLHPRKSRYIRLAETYLQHVLTIVTFNLCRLTACVSGESRAHRRRPAFESLVAAAAFA